jgi:predicted DNA-binding mobile mystery protein A
LYIAKFTNPMRTKKKLLIEQLDRKLKPFVGTEKVIIPDQGWINSIRITLNMTLEQLGSKLNITRQGAKKIEESEAVGTVSLKSMKEIGRVLNMQFVYGFVPIDGSIENLVNRKAEELAKKIVLRTSQNMKLENQGNTEEQINSAISDLAIELKRELNKSLWD